MAVLIIKKESACILQYPLNGHLIRIGRDETSDIHLMGECVSRLHATLTPTDEGYRYENLGRNGTVLNRHKITDHILQPGDVLSIADWQLQFMTDSMDVQTETILSATAPRYDRVPKLSFVGDSLSVRTVKSQIERFAQSDAPVCILGETGCGKEVAAAAIHAASERASGPFVAVNCGAIPETMIESELFGYEKGAFTGAVRDHRGYFGQANGGTLFLDEIGELPLEMQTRLLRVLETSSFRRLGAQSNTRSDFRIICATHRNLQQAVGEGRLREDLFFRLFVLPLTVPPLRDRVTDIPILVDHFSKLFGRREIIWSDAALDKLVSHSWPGNVRELKNTVQRSLVMAASSTISENDIYILPPASVVPPERLDFQERAGIVTALIKHNGNNTHAADELGISRTTLIAKIKKFGIGSQELS